MSFIKQATHILLPWLPHTTIEFNDWIYWTPFPFLILKWDVDDPTHIKKPSSTTSSDNDRHGMEIIPQHGMEIVP